MVLSILVLTCNFFNHQPTTKITQQSAYLFTDDILYFSEDIANAYHITPLGLQHSPVVFSTTTFGFLGVNLPINIFTSLPADPDSDTDTYEVVD